MLVIAPETLLTCRVIGFGSRRASNAAAGPGLANQITEQGKEVLDIFTVTKKAAALLKAAKAADTAGIRILRSASEPASGKSAVGLAISEEPYPDDEEFEQDGLRIFVEDTLVELLDDRMLDVRDANAGPELVWR